MLKQMKAFLPLLVVVMIVVNLIGSYAVGNTNAMYANITALIGWVMISFESFKELSNTK